MSEMVERVAVALFETEETGYPGLSVPFAEQSRKVRERYRELARAAIETMHEPTQTMVDAAHEVPSDHARHHWRAMIDAALSEEAR